MASFRSFLVVFFCGVAFWWSKTVPDSLSTQDICADDLDCSLNGICDIVNFGAKCTCDKPWSGPKCDLLNFKPVQFPQGYGMLPNFTSWGGGILYDSVTDTHHLFVARMTNNCSLEHWGTNSRVDHAISKTGPTGPYHFHDIAIDTFSHNPAPLKLPDGTFAIMHVGLGEGGPNGGDNCSTISSDDAFKSTFDDENEHFVPRDLKMDAFETPRSSFLQVGGSNIHVSSSLHGPWKPLKNDLGNCNNPGPFIHPNGTIYVECGLVLKRADSIAGPYTDIAQLPTGPIRYEDLQIYIDQRGHFHCIYHASQVGLPSNDCVNSTVSAHAFSGDGITWHLSSIPPYGTQLELSTGETITLATRERPKPFFQNGIMTHLVQGVCGSPSCEPPAPHPLGCVNCKYRNWDFTLVAPLDVEETQN
jgi:hypothetical protein